MDSASLTMTASTVLEMLAPFLAVFDTKVVGMLYEGVPTGVGKLWEVIRGRFEDDEFPRNALDQLVSDPQSERLRIVVTWLIEELLKNDSAFMEQVEKALQEAQQPDCSTPQPGGDYGDQAVDAEGNLAYLDDARFQAQTWYLPAEDLLGFVEIPGGPFLMGSDPNKDKDAKKEEIPQHTVDLEAFYIARYPVTVAQFRAFVEDSSYQPEDLNCLGDLPNRPVRYVTWYEAIRYCEWLDEKLRNDAGTPLQLAEKLKKGAQVILPSEAEWEKAARGDDGRIYPWGDEFDPTKANVCESGADATSAVGCFPDGASPYGLLDMSGNVWEWTRSIDKGYPYKITDGREDLKAGNDALRILRGGSFNYYNWYARCAFRGGYFPDFRRSSYGFRVVVSAIISSQ